MDQGMEGGLVAVLHLGTAKYTRYRTRNCSQGAATWVKCFKERLLFLRKLHGEVCMVCEELLDLNLCKRRHRHQKQISRTLDCLIGNAVYTPGLATAHSNKHGQMNVRNFTC